jgi:hypothetical protein
MDLFFRGFASSLFLVPKPSGTGRVLRDAEGEGGKPETFLQKNKP